MSLKLKDYFCLKDITKSYKYIPLIFFRYIQHYQKWLTRRHYFICQVKIQLVQLIGTDPKELMVVPENQLNKKLEYVKELLELYENLVPCK